MSKRLNQQREKELTPKRVSYAMDKIKEKGYDPHHENGTIVFDLDSGAQCVLYCYSGWWSAKGIGSGRGIERLLNLI